MRPGTDAVAPEADEGRIVAELRLRGDGRPACWDPPAIREILCRTGSPRIRNAAAMALSDLRDPEGAVRIAEILGRPETAGSAGTLVHALNAMGADLPFPALENVVRHGSWEAREEALDLLWQGRVVLGEDRTLEDRIAVLRGLAENGAPDVRSAAESCLAGIAAVRAWSKERPSLPG